MAQTLPGCGPVPGVSAAPRLPGCGPDPCRASRRPAHGSIVIDTFPKLSVTEAPEHEAAVAVIEALPLTPLDAVTVKFAEVCPAGTVTELAT